MSIVYFNGAFVDESEAVLPVTTHAMHYGTAVFEGIRSYGDGNRAAIFRPREHYERFLRNAALLEMSPAEDPQELTRLTAELLRRNGFRDDRYIRPLLYKSARTIGAGLPRGETLAIFAVPMARGPVPRPAATATISRWRRFPAAACPAGAKITGLYVNSSLARADAAARGFDQAILLNTAGSVAEGYGANLFALFGHEVVTPPAEADILPGITRETILRFLRDRGDLSVSTDWLALERLTTADEVFFCGTGMEIVPVSRIDEKTIGSGSQPITDAVSAWYQNVVTGKTTVEKQWLAPVD